MGAELIYQQEYAGQLCVGNGYVELTTDYRDEGTFSSGNWKGWVLGICTGYFVAYEGNDRVWVQVKNTLTNTDSIMYVRGALLNEQPPAVSLKRNNAQEELNRLLKDHKYIMQNLEVCAMYAQANAALPKFNGYSANKIIALIYNRLRERESQLIDDDLVESTATGYNQGAYTAGQEALANIIRTTPISGIGAIPAVAIYVIAAVVSLAVGAFIYYKIKNMRTAADYDLNLSNEFLSWLKKQSPETTKIVLDQLKATGDSAYKAALNEKGTGLVNWIKNAGTGVKFALMAAGAFLVWTQVDKMQTNKAKRKFKYGR